MKSEKVIGLILIIMFYAETVMAMDMGIVDIHGFVSQGYLLSDANNYLANSSDGSFQFNEAGLNFGRQLTDKLHVGIQFFARDQGKIGNNEVVIDWAYADYHWKDWAGLRVGLIRIPYGLYNETRDLDMLRPGILLPQSIYSEGRRDAFSRIRGAGGYGEIPAGAAGRFSYQVLTGTSDFDEDGGIAREIETFGGLNVREIGLDTAYIGALQWHTPLDGLKIGFTGLKVSEVEADLESTAQLSPFIPEGTGFTYALDLEAMVFSAEYTRENLVLAAEYMTMTLTYEVDRLLPEDEVRPEGYYVSASYRLTDWFELGGGYSVYYYDKDDRDGKAIEASGGPDHSAWQKDISLSARFDIHENWTFKAEGHFMDGTGLLLSQDNPDGSDEDWFLLAAKMTFCF